MKISIDYRKKLFLQFILFTIFCASIAFPATILLHSRELTLFSMFLLLCGLVVFIFLLKFKKTKLKFQFYDIYFWVQNLTTLKERSIYYDNVKSYSISFSNNNFCEIIIKLYSGKKLQYSFSNKKSSDEVSADELLNCFHTNFKKYNEKFRTRLYDLIMFKPSFYASKLGLYMIILTILVLVIGILLYIEFEKNLPFTFLIPFLLVGQMIFRRVKDKTYFDQISRSINPN